MTLLARFTLVSALALGASAISGCTGTAPHESPVREPSATREPSAPTPPSTAERSLTMEGGRSAPPAAKLSEVQSGSVPCSADDSWVLVDDGQTRRKLSLGRQLTPARGALHSFAEVVVHEDGSEVFHVEALGKQGTSEYLTLTAMLPAAASLPGAIPDTRLEMMRADSNLERNELTGRAELVLNRFGNVGELVDAVFGPVPIASRAGATANVTVQVHVCRTQNWRVSR